MKERGRKRKGESIHPLRVGRGLPQNKLLSVKNVSHTETFRETSGKPDRKDEVRRFRLTCPLYRLFQWLFSHAGLYQKKFFFGHGACEGVERFTPDPPPGGSHPLKGPVFFRQGCQDGDAYHVFSPVQSGSSGLDDRCDETGRNGARALSNGIPSKGLRSWRKPSGTAIGFECQRNERAAPSSKDRKGSSGVNHLTAGQNLTAF